MRKLLNKPWFVAVLAIVAVAAIVSARFDGAAHVAPGRVGAFADPMADFREDEDSTADAASARLSIPDALAALVIPAVLPDPFARRGPNVVAGAPDERPAESEQTESVRLSAIWRQDGTDLVLVNDRIQRVGDAVGRVTIESVNLDGIWVTHWKGRTFVPLGGSFTLATPVRVAAGALALQ